MDGGPIDDPTTKGPGSGLFDTSKDIIESATRQGTLTEPGPLIIGTITLGGEGRGGGGAIAFGWGVYLMSWLQGKFILI